MKIIYLVKEKDENKIIESFNSLEEAEEFIKNKLKEAKAELRKFYASEGKCCKCPYGKWLTETELSEITKKIPKCYKKKKYIEPKPQFNFMCSAVRNFGTNAFGPNVDEFMCYNYKYVKEPKLPEFYIEELKTELTTEEELLEKIKEVEIWKKAFNLCWSELQGIDDYYTDKDKNKMLYEAKKSIIKRLK